MSILTSDESYFCCVWYLKSIILFDRSKLSIQLENLSEACYRGMSPRKFRSKPEVDFRSGHPIPRTRTRTQDQDPGPDFGHRWRTIKVVNNAKNIQTSTEYQNWHNVLYIHQFLSRNWHIYYFFWPTEFGYFSALQHDIWAPRTSPGPGSSGIKT